MVNFQLARESAYLVPAIRRVSKDEGWLQRKLFPVITAGVLLAHIALFGWMLNHWVDERAGFASNDMEAAVILEDDAPSPRSAQSVPPPPQPKVQEEKKVKHQMPPQQLPLYHNSTPEMPIVVPKQPTNPTPTAASGEPKNSVGSASNAPSIPSASSGAPAVSAVSTTQCATLVAFNRHYPGVLKDNATVTLRISRTESGSVGGVSLTNSSGNGGLDQFALNSARQARFKPNEGCGNRSFILPILFKARA